jgi:ring-1,2-phenylacetyl-CoA epoxidase subunit PaaE
MSTFHNLKVENIKKETSNSVVISFNVSQDLISFFNYLPGQYVSIKLLIDNKEVLRDYSICSSKNEILSIAIKEIADGYASSFLNNSINIGDVVLVSAPKGKFVLDGNSDEDSIGIAAGSGITPIMSMLKTTLLERSNKFFLVYSNKCPEDTMFLKELIKLKEDYPDRLFLNLIYTKIEIEKHYFGRINSSNICKFIGFENFNNNKIYICGPEKMLFEVKAGLETNNVLNENICYELFKSAEENKFVVTDNGDVEIIYTVDDYTSKIKSTKEKTVLDSALDNDIDAPYSCSGGVCGSCIGRLKSGDIKMLKNTVLTDSEVSDGLILACQAIPVSDMIEIDFDDV